MEGRKENKYNLTGICPECGKLFKVELTIATELVEEGTTTEEEEKPDAGKEGEAAGPAEATEEPGVRPDRNEGPGAAGSAGAGAKDPGKGKRSKKAGGEKR